MFAGYGYDPPLGQSEPHTDGFVLRWLVRPATMLAGRLGPRRLPRPTLLPSCRHHLLLTDGSERVVRVVMPVALEADVLQPLQRFLAALLAAVHQMVNVLAPALAAPLAHPLRSGNHLQPLGLPRRVNGHGYTPAYGLSWAVRWVA